MRSISAIKDLAAFRRFLALLASRAGSVLNKTDLAAPLGISVPALTEWLNILEITGQVIVVPPFYENFGKRLIIELRKNNGQKHARFFAKLNDGILHQKLGETPGNPAPQRREAGRAPRPHGTHPLRSSWCKIP